MFVILRRLPGVNHAFSPFASSPFSTVSVIFAFEAKKGFYALPGDCAPDIRHRFGSSFPP